MKRKIPYLAASGMELVRFIALMLLAGNLGLAGEDSGTSRLFRYAVVPQLLFAAGFFFLWLDADRYGPYRPLLAVGKIVSLAGFAPFAAFILFSWESPALGLLDFRSAFVASLFVAAEDAASLVVLVLCRARGGEASRNAREPSDRPAVGQAPEDIERVEV
jgi:hypothetical protein